MSIHRRFVLAGALAALALSVCDEPAPSVDMSEEVERFPLCEPPDPHDARSFEVELDGLADAAELDLRCEVDATTTGGEPSALVLLGCGDASVAIALELFHDEIALPAEGTEVRLRYRRGGPDAPQHLALRRLDDDALLLFAARGLDAFPAASAGLWAPLQISEVDAALCPAVGECDTHRRGALDFTLGGASERVLDHDWKRLPGARFEAHVRLAHEVIANATGACPSDAPSGRYSEVVVLGR